MATLTVDRRFCGPATCANGGYIAGLIAQQAPDQVRVRLERPVPLQAALELRSTVSGGLELLHDREIVARTLPADRFDFEVPAPPNYLEALEASRHVLGFSHHPAPRCFVCGTERARGDGLRVFAGRCGHRPVLAAPWVPDATLSDGQGKVRPEFISAVLDCPGAFAARDDVVPMLLGEFTAHIDRRVHIDEPCVVIGWKIESSGRKYQVGTALFDEDGELCARARGLWIELKGAPADERSSL